MSQANVEVARRIYANADLFRATTDQIDRAYRENLDEDFEFRLPPDYPEGELVFRGRDGIDQLIAMLSETWGEWRFETEGFRDAGDQVVVFAHIVGRGEESGAPFELETTHLVTIRAGRASSAQVYRSRSEALEAAGLGG